jgi:hypothetical protein
MQGLFLFYIMSITKILNSRNYQIVSKQLARVLGIEQAYLLGFLSESYDYFDARGELCEGGGFFVTATDMEAKTGLSTRAQGRILEALNKAGIIEQKTQKNKAGAPCRFFFFMEGAKERVVSILSLENPFLQKRKMDFAETQNGLCRNAKWTLRKCKMDFAETQNDYKDKDCKDKDYKDKEEETAIAVPSLENNSDELFSEAKKSDTENKKTETPPAASPAPALAAPTADEKRKKVAAKKEKAPIQRTAITAEFEQRGLLLFASAKTQPSDEWYAKTVGKYGLDNVWAIFQAMHDYCEATGLGYAAPANGFTTWAVSSGGFEVFNALRGYWRNKYGGEEWKALGELTKGEKAALDSLALKFKARIASRNLLTTVSSNARQFFDNLPEKWSTPQWFNLSKIDQELTSIYAAMITTLSAPAHGSGTTTTADGSIYAKDGSILYQSDERFAELKRQIKDFS